jgi:hypothetical protein
LLGLWLWFAQLRFDGIAANTRFPGSIAPTPGDKYRQASDSGNSPSAAAGHSHSPGSVAGSVSSRSSQLGGAGTARSSAGSVSSRQQGGGGSDARWDGGGRRTTKRSGGSKASWHNRLAEPKSPRGWGGHSESPRSNNGTGSGGGVGNRSTRQGGRGRVARAASAPAHRPGVDGGPDRFLERMRDAERERQERLEQRRVALEEEQHLKRAAALERSTAVRDQRSQPNHPMKPAIECCPLYPRESN